MPFLTALVIGHTTRVALPWHGADGSFPEDTWAVNVNGTYYVSIHNPGVYNVSFVEEIQIIIGGLPTWVIVADVYIIPGATSIGNPISALYFYTGLASPHLSVYEATFTAVCMNLDLLIVQVGSVPVPSTSPQQFTHYDSVLANPIGGTAPLTYSNWSTTVGTLVNFYADNSYCELTVTNTTPDSVPPF